MPVLALVRNLSPGPAVFTHKSATFGDVAIEWQGAGDVDGEDSQQVPEVVLNDVAFRKACRRGIFLVEEMDDEAALARWEEQQASFLAKIKARGGDVEDVMDRSEERAIVVISEGELVDGKPTEKQIPVTVSTEQLASAANA